MSQSLAIPSGGVLSERRRAVSFAIHNSLMEGLPMPDDRTLGLLREYADGVIGADELVERGFDSRL